MRIWWVGTTRILGVLPDEAEIVPEVVRKYVSTATNVYADSEVCPFTQRQPGVMQDVCVEAATNVVIERYLPGQATPEVSRIPR
jgi:hypothetical protein